ncbi:hypothetical protein [Methanoregula sp.]|uniref:hypothetical protein n=1 Tax=Methanoregula sp. TaxID=2052170 RepID=UPI003C772A00
MDLFDGENFRRFTIHEGIPEARDIAIEKACNCPSGRLVIHEWKTEKAIETALEKSIIDIEYPPRGEHGPLWVLGRITVESANGKQYTVRKRLTLAGVGNPRTSRSATAAMLNGRREVLFLDPYTQ